jgi:branched-chain amino acid transport system ATP-binding protein
MKRLRVLAHALASSKPWTAERVFELFPRLLERRNQRAGSLSGGEQQMLTIARTLMGSPQVLLLDEPFEGLVPLVVDMLAEQLGRLKAEGLTMVVTEQNARFVSELGKRVYVLERGTVRYCDTMSEFLRDDDVRRTYLAV